MLRTRAGRVRAWQATPPPRRQKQPKKQTSQPHGERQQKRAKIRRFCDRKKRRRRPKASPPSRAAERLELPRIIITYAAGFAFSAGAPLASPTSFQRATAAPARPAWQTGTPPRIYFIGLSVSYLYNSLCSSPLSPVPQKACEREAWDTVEAHLSRSAKDLRGSNDRKDILLIPFLKRFTRAYREEGVYTHTVSRKILHWERESVRGEGREEVTQNLM